MNLTRLNLSHCNLLNATYPMHFIQCNLLNTIYPNAAKNTPTKLNSTKPNSTKLNQTKLNPSQLNPNHKHHLPTIIRIKKGVNPMETLRVAVCDDDRVYLEQIKEEIKEYIGSMPGTVDMQVSLFTDGRRLYEAGQQQPFDLVFLDIEMPERDGFWLAEQLGISCPETRLIFVSSHESWVFDAHEYMPLWFVRKGLLKRDMGRALQKYFQVTARRKISYKIQGGFGAGEVLLRDIMYIECNGHTLTYKMSGGAEYSVYGSLKPVAEELRDYGFLRIHRNYLVNQAYISQIEKQDAVLKNGAVIPMGRDRKKGVREMMMEYGRKHGSRLCD